MTIPSWQSRLIASLIVTIAALGATVRRGEAHKPITSKYTFNEDVFPIFRDKCGRCHVEGGVAPMSLMTYEAAFPWSESIRAELVASHMPPANALRGFGALKHANLLTATEVDTVLTWATGGNPRGSLEQQLPKVVLNNAWTLGTPDVTLTLPEVTLAADKMEQTEEFTIPTGTTDARWLRAADLRPGTPSVVRSAVIVIKAGPEGELGAEHVLRRWLPGQDVESIDQDGAAFKLPANAAVSVQVHYKKTWQAEGQSPKDKSSIGLYFAPKANGRELLVVPIAGPSAVPPSDRKLTFSHTIDRDVEALALSPDDVPPNITLTASAMLPDGRRVPLVRMHTRSDWTRRFWFEHPIALPAGTKIEVIADFNDPDELASEAFGGFDAPKASPTQSQRLVKVSLDVTSG